MKLNGWRNGWRAPTPWLKGIRRPEPRVDKLAAGMVLSGHSGFVRTMTYNAATVLTGAAPDGARGALLLRVLPGLLLLSGARCGAVANA
jgi:hypothetical protein